MTTKCDDIVAVDTETTGVHPWLGDRAFGFGFVFASGPRLYYEWDVDPFTRKPKVSRRDRRKMREIMENPRLRKVFHNAKFDQRMFDEGLGIDTLGLIDDTMFMAHVCNSNEPSFALKNLIAKYADDPTLEHERILEAAGKARRLARPLGWSLKYDETEQIDGTVKRKAAVPADYWMLRALVKTHRKLLTVSQRQCWPKLCRKYCLMDCEYTLLLFMMYRGLLETNGMQTIYDNEMELHHVTYDMESRGVACSADNVAMRIKQYKKAATHHMNEVKRLSWASINVNSTKQMKKLLFGDLGIKPTKMTPTGEPSVGWKALQFYEDNEVVHNLLKHRSVAKGYATWFAIYKKMSIPDPLNPGGRCLHPSFRQLGGRTGRYSCSEPNLQNPPSPEATRSHEPIHARTPFGPRPGYAWLCLDYRGMEVRIFAEIAQEPHMLEAIRKGRVIHTEITNRVWGGKGNERAIDQISRSLEIDGNGAGGNEKVEAAHRHYGVKDPDHVSSVEVRRICIDFLDKYGWDIVRSQAALGKKNTKSKAKELTFLKMYGGGVKAACDIIGCEMDEAIEQIAAYDDAFPRINEFQREVVMSVRQCGYIETAWGRKLYVDRDMAYRGVNYTIQGTAADILKSAMRRTVCWFKKNHVDGHLVLTIHDENIYEVRIKELTWRVVTELKKIMEDMEGHLTVPMPVDPEVTFTTWDRKRKIRGWDYR